MLANEDHRQKNIELAKNLNAVKIDLRNQKQDFKALEAVCSVQKNEQLKLKQQTNEISNQIAQFKRQLDNTFMQNTIGYIQLSQEIDRILIKSGRKSNDIPSALNSSIKQTNTSFHLQIKMIPNSPHLNFSGSNLKLSTSQIMLKTPSPRKRSLNETFDAFSPGIPSPIEFSEDSILDTTFVQFKKSPNPNRSSKIPLMQPKSKKKSKVITSTVNRMRSRFKSTPIACTNDIKSDRITISKRGRIIKKLDYNENSMYH